MNWTYNETELNEIPDGYIGFIYRITNLLTGRMYIGKKNFFSTITKTKTVILKTTGGKKKKRVKQKNESDWSSYYGSSDELRNDVESLGAENFKREIIHLCKSKGELSYMEAKFQFEEDVLLNPKLYYNAWISVRTRRIHLKDMIHD